MIWDSLSNEEFEGFFLIFYSHLQMGIFAKAFEDYKQMSETFENDKKST